ncbi:hypothetical protein MRB53_012426 [Persea americana]|uniref:Uncharacterized protein n=1 Tax=Persea americana TaxID=3435 RepID=A0ACC2LYQ5_PERAE|nr:hypothetical protein MRB53_012426 [Persea americana]
MALYKKVLSTSFFHFVIHSGSSYIHMLTTGEAAKRKPLDWQTRLSIALGAARGENHKQSREPLNIHRPRNEWSLVEWAKTFFREARIEEIVDPTMKAGYHAEAMWRVVELALACIETLSAYRPCMDDIVRELEDAFIIENNASEYMKSI